MMTTSSSSSQAEIGLFWKVGEEWIGGGGGARRKVTKVIIIC